jgi:hypothetical protein
MGHLYDVGRVRLANVNGLAPSPTPLRKIAR